MRKIVCYVPVTEGIMRDSGWIGERGVWNDTDEERWRAMWHDRPGQTLFDRFLRQPPPWESWDQPAMPELSLFPRVVERLLSRLSRRDNTSVTGTLV